MYTKEQVLFACRQGKRSRKYLRVKRRLKPLPEDLLRSSYDSTFEMIRSLHLRQTYACCLILLYVPQGILILCDLT